MCVHVFAMQVIFMFGLISDYWRGLTVVFGSVLMLACSHPLEIKGEGDILSASGMRDCYLEDFRAGLDACSKNLVVGEYQETYYAVPREGWQFVAWENCFNDGAVADQCIFNIPANLVRNSYGQTVAALVAVFEETNSGPVAMYSYAVDDDGLLTDPLPLEGAQLARKLAYFTYTGDFESASFWCCKVSDGDEAHGEKVEDRIPPLVLAVDLGTLPDDGGLQRELYADLFASATDYSSHAAYWTLVSPEITVVRSSVIPMGIPAINNKDEIVWSQVTDGVNTTWSSKRGQISDGIENSTNPKINDRGEVIWKTGDGSEHTRNAIVSNIRGVVYLGQCSPFDPYYTSLDINNHGEIIWGGHDCASTVYKEEIWSNVRGRLTFSPDNTINREISINDAGEVVYISSSAFGKNLISTERGVITDDSDRWPSSPDINNNGEIVWLQRRDPLWLATTEIWSNMRGRITDNIAVIEYYPDVNDSGEIVWAASDGHDLEIFSSLRGQITDNEAEDRYPMINNRGTIAWVSVENAFLNDLSEQKYSLLAIYGQQ